MQAQSGVEKVTEDKAISLASVHEAVNITAKEHVILTVQGRKSSSKAETS